MAGYEVDVSVPGELRGEAKHFVEFLRNTARRLPARVTYRSAPSGLFAISIDGPSASIDGVLQGLILNRGLYYYVCALTGSTKRDVISKVVVPIYQALIEGRFDNPYSHLVRRHLTGQLESGFMPGDFVEEFSHEYETLFRKWSLGMVSDWDFVKDLDSLLTRFMLTKMGHRPGERSPPYNNLVEKARKHGLVLVEETVDLFNEVHRARTGGLHRLQIAGSDQVRDISMRTYSYFEYFDEFDLAQQVPTEKLHGKRYRRIKYGFEKSHIEFAKKADPPYDYVLSAKERPCHDCAVVFGQFHVFGCDWEQCARCGGQRLGCECALASD